MDVVPMSPLTTVKILKNVPLDNRYRDTLDFSSVSLQSAYFSGKSKYTFNNCTPVKMQNTIRIPRKADDLYDCNYIMFQNANFNNKWFYAFVKKINYINVNMCTVEFEIDVMQTWQFDVTLKPSFVEREHTNDDTIGSNLVTENLELGDYVSNGISFSETIQGQYSIIVASTVDQNGNNVQGGLYGGIYSGVELIEFTSYTAVNTFIDYLTTNNKADAIVSIFMMPSHFTTLLSETALKYENVLKEKNSTNIDGYIPKNNKLFTAPYNLLYVTNLQGNSAIFPYEYFSDSNYAEFTVTCDMSCNPTLVLYPVNYKKVTGANYNEKLVLDGFPQCAYNIDTFKAWVAQNGASTAVSMLGSAFSLGSGAIASNPSSVVNGAFSIASTVAQIHAISTQPPHSHGATGSSVNLAMGIKDFAFMNLTIRSEFAKIIDDYFSLYGYATHKVKIPNTTGRPSWNYVKTIDCKMIGSVPFDDITKMKNIYDNGITFWHGDYVGDYSRNNQLGGV